MKQALYNYCITNPKVIEEIKKMMDELYKDLKNGNDIMKTEELIEKYRNYPITADKKYRELIDISDDQYEFIKFLLSKIILKIKNKSSNPVLTREAVIDLIKYYFPDLN